MTTDNFHLSRQDKQLIQLYADGHTAKTMWSVLQVVPRTIESRTQALKRKCLVKNIPALVAFGFRNKFID